MFTENAFAELSALVPPAVMQTYVIFMILLVVAGTLFDIWHKKSATYFFNNWRKSQAQGDKSLGGASVGSLAVTNSFFRSPRVLRILQSKTAHRSPADDVRFPALCHYHGYYGVRLSDTRNADTGHLSFALDPRRLDGVRRRLLVLVRHSR